MAQIAIQGRWVLQVWKTHQIALSRSPIKLVVKDSSLFGTPFGEIDSLFPDS